MQKYFPKEKILILYLAISLLLFIPKWAISFYLFDENLLLKFIIDSDHDSQVYFPFIVDLSKLNFSGIEGNGFNKNLIFPIGTIIFHAIFFKFFGPETLIIFELLSIFLFLIIFSKILEYFIANEFLSIFISVLIFSISSVFLLINFKFYNLENLTNLFFNLRFPRPMLAHIFYFYFFYLILDFANKSFFFNKTNAFKIALIFSLSFMSFHNIFYYKLLLFFALILVSYKEIFANKISFLQFFMYIILFFTILVTPFVHLYINAAPDYLTRLGILNNDLSTKSLLIAHYYNKFLSIKFFLIFFIFTLLILLLKKQKEKKLRIIKLFGVINFFSLFLFIMISPKIHHLYHYVNIFILNIFIVNLILFIVLIKNQIIKINNIIILTVTILVIFIYNISYITHQKQYFSEDKTDDRKDLKLIVDKLENQNLIKMLNNDLMIFDGVIFNYLKFKGKNNFIPVSAFYTTNNNIQQENELIQTLKFIGFDKKKFVHFIKNELQIHKYQNKELQTYFLHRYQANQLTTFNRSKDFTNQEINFISQSGPSFTHQSILPLSELLRLEKKFEEYKIINNLNPDLIVVNKTKKFENLKFNNSGYCIIHESLQRIVFVKKKMTSPCIRFN